MKQIEKSAKENTGRHADNALRPKVIKRTERKTENWRKRDGDRKKKVRQEKKRNRNLQKKRLRRQRENAEKEKEDK